MNTKIAFLLGIYLLFLTTASASSISAYPDFNIDNNASYTNSPTVTLFYSLTADTNCTVCFSETNDNAVCSIRTSCASILTNSPFTLSSFQGLKTVYAFVYDNNVYASSSANASITLDTITPTASVSGVTDGNVYDVNTFSPITVTLLTNGGTALDKDSLTFSGTQTFSGNTLTLPSAGIADGNYTITIDANNLAGNNLHKVVSFAVDTTPPSTGSISFSGWTNSDKPTFSISATDNMGTTGMKMQFSCNNTTWTTWVPYATSYSDFNINDPTYGCDRSDSNKDIYIKFKDAVGNVGTSTYRTTVLYDTTLPNPPLYLTATPKNGAVTLTWNSPTDINGGSGNQYIALYQNGNIITTTIGITTTSYDINGLTNGIAYLFKLKTIDAAGNYSVFSNEVNTTPSGTNAVLSVKKNGVTVNYAKINDVLNVRCDLSASATNMKIIGKYYNPTTTETTLTSSTSSVSSLTSDFTINSTNGGSSSRVGFWCTADDSSGTDITYVTIDNNAPTITWNDTNNQFSNVKRVSVTANDTIYLDSVKFDFNNNSYTSTKDSSNTYYFDLNTLLFENGNYTLNATATDGAGNITQISRTVTLNNIQSEKQKAQKALDDALASKRLVINLIEYYKTSGLAFPTDLNAQKISADALLATGQSALATDSTTAQTKGISAKALYDEINTKGKVEITQSKSADFTADGLADALTKAGLTPAQVTEAQALMNSAKPTRKLSIVKIGTDRYQAKIELTIKNDTNESVLQVIEIIPKEFASSASSLFASSDFNIINNDPVIEFTVRVAKGQTATISYGSGELTKSAADALITNNTLAKFSTAPIMLKESTQVASQLGTNMLFSPLIIAAIVLVLLVIGVIALVVRFKKPGEPFGEDKTLVEHVIPAPTPEKKDGPKWSKE